MTERPGGSRAPGDGGEHDLPEVPEAPVLPEAPALRPNLPPHPDRQADPRATEYRRMGLAYAMPTALIAPIVGLTLLGYWLDGHFGWAPWGVVGGALLGTTVGLINMVRMAARLGD